MRARSIGAVVLVGVIIAALASTASAAPAATNSITVWLQTDAQAANWEPIVKAANAAFQKDHPGVTVNVQYQTLGQPPAEVRRDAGRRQCSGRHRDGQHRDDEVHGCRRLPGPLGRQGVAAELGHVARGPGGLRPLRRQAVRRPLLRRLAGRHVPHRRLQAGGPQGSDEPRAVHGGGQEARGQGLGQELLARLHRRHRLVLRDELRLRLRRLDRDARQRQVEGHAVLAPLDGRADGVQELLHRGLARQQDDRRDPSQPVRRVRPGQGRLDGRAGLVQLLRRRHQQEPSRSSS